MAKTKTTSTEEVVTTTETVSVQEEVQTIKPRIIIARMSTPFRTMPSMEAKYTAGQMPVGTAYEIIREVSSKIYGDFYQLNNGYYVTKNNNYSIS